MDEATVCVTYSDGSSNLWVISDQVADEIDYELCERFGQPDDISFEEYEPAVYRPMQTVYLPGDGPVGA